MQCKSTSTINVDAYEAGIEIGSNLKAVSPEAIIVFASVHYGDFADFFEGLYDGLETKDVIVFGGTGDGFYESSRVEHVGISALAINSGGKIKWTLTVEPGMSENSYRAGKACAKEIKQAAGDEVKFAFVMAGMAGDGTTLTEGIRSELSIPCVGGLTADDRKIKQGIVLANGETHNDAVGILALSGDIAFALNLASGWTPFGQTAIVEEVHENRIVKIGGKTAVDFIHQQFGKPPSEVDITTLSMAAYQRPGSDQFALRTPYKIDEDGTITYFGSIEEGTPVQVCMANREDVINGVNEALDGLPQLDFEPAAALILSCANRKWILGEQTKEEVERVTPSLAPSLPLIGLPTFGEIAPYQNKDGSYTGTYFHNLTYIIILLGTSA